VPAVPSCILEPLREQLLALLPVWHVVHPLGCHRPRIADAVVFKLVEALVFGAGCERIACPGCSATTIRRRRDEWIRLGVWDRLRLACLDAYEKMIGLDLADLAVDGCTTKAVCGGQCAGRSPVDRAKGGLKRSQLTDGAGIPLAAVSAPANTVDHTLLTATLDAIKDFQPLPEWVTVHLDAGYDHRPAWQALADRDLHGQIAHCGEPAPIQGPPLSRRAHPRLAQRLRQAPPLHRTPPRLCRRLPLPGRGHHHHPCSAPGRLIPLPLGHPATNTTRPLTCWRTL
jgi:transposase